MLVSLRLAAFSLLLEVLEPLEGLGRWMVERLAPSFPRRSQFSS